MLRLAESATVQIPLLARVSFKLSQELSVFVLLERTLLYLLHLLHLDLVLELLELVSLLQLLLDQTLELALLQVADQDLPLLVVAH